MELPLLQNAVRIKESKKPAFFLVSSHRYDFNIYTFSNGAIYAVDGGHDYARRVYGDFPNGVKIDNYTLSGKEKLSVIRARLLWGTYGKKGDQPLTWVLLKECVTAHLKAILKTQSNLHPTTEKVIKSILANRAKKNKRRTVKHS